MSTNRHVLLLPGSLRTGSSNDVMLRTAAAAAPEGVSTTLYAGLGGLPHFNPDDDSDPLPAPVAALREAIAAADAILVCTPEYAGTLPGSFKNLLDWTVGGVEISDKPTGWINAANPGRGEGAEATLRMVLDYTGAAVLDEACVRIAVDREAVGPDGLLGDPAVREQLAKVLTVLTAG